MARALAPVLHPVAAMIPHLPLPASPHLDLVREDPNVREELARERAVSRLAGGFAHEVANPLSVISGFAQVMAGEDGRSADDVEALKHILDSVRRCLRLMGAWQKLSSHAQPRRTTSVDLGACVEDAVLLLQGSWRMRPKLSVRVVRAAGITHAAAPATAMVHAMVQLLEGAVDLLGSDEAQLQVRVLARGDGALLSIDGFNGSPMTPDLVPEGLRVAKAVLASFGGMVEWCAAGGHMLVEAWVPSEQG